MNGTVDVTIPHRGTITPLREKAFNENESQYPMRNISILMAMKNEAEPLIRALKLQTRTEFFRSGIPFELFQGELGSTRLSLMVSGTDPTSQVDNVATIPATLMTYLAVERLRPEIVINAGTAGGRASKGCKIGEVYLSTGQFYFHDRRIPIPGFDSYGIGAYQSYDTSAMATELNLKTGIISTGNSLDLLDRDFEMIKRSHATIKDMEATAIAWVCTMLSVPVFAIKAITDLIDVAAATETQFLENLKRASHNLQEKTIEVLRYLEKLA